MNLNLPELEGSQKQINWAKDIRKGYINLITEIEMSSLDDLTSTETLEGYMFDSAIYVFLPRLPYSRSFGFKTSANSKEDALQSVEEKKNFMIKSAIDDGEFTKNEIDAIAGLYERTGDLIKQVTATENTTANHYALRKGLEEVKRKLLFQYAVDAFNGQTSAEWWIDHRGNFSSQFAQKDHDNEGLLKELSKIQLGQELSQLSINSLPELEGSQAQINWAKDIRGRYLKFITEISSASLGDLVKPTLVKNRYKASINAFFPRIALKILEFASEEDTSELPKNFLAIDDDYKDNLLNAIKHVHKLAEEVANQVPEELVKEVKAVTGLDENTLKRRYAFEEVKRQLLIQYMQEAFINQTSAKWWIDHK